MVTRKRLRTILNTLCFYVLAALLIGYFGINAYSGNRGLRAKAEIDEQSAKLSAELARLQHRQAQLQRRINLLMPDNIDPDLLDERARALLDYANRDDLVLVLKPAPVRRIAPMP